MTSSILGGVVTPLPLVIIRPFLATYNYLRYILSPPALLPPRKRIIVMLMPPIERLTRRVIHVFKKLAQALAQCRVHSSQLARAGAFITPNMHETKCQIVALNFFRGQVYLFLIPWIWFGYLLVIALKFQWIEINFVLLRPGGFVNFHGAGRGRPFPRPTGRASLVHYIYMYHTYSFLCTENNQVTLNSRDRTEKHCLIVNF